MGCLRDYAGPFDWLVVSSVSSRAPPPRPFSWDFSLSVLHQGPPLESFDLPSSRTSGWVTGLFWGLFLPFFSFFFTFGSLPTDYWWSLCLLKVPRPHDSPFFLVLHFICTHDQALWVELLSEARKTIQQDSRSAAPGWEQRCQCKEGSPTLWWGKPGGRSSGKAVSTVEHENHELLHQCDQAFRLPPGTI